MTHKEEVKRKLEFMLRHSDLSTYELAEKFGIKEYEVAKRLIQKED